MSIDGIAALLYDNPAVATAVVIAIFFIAGYIIKKMKTIIIILLIIVFVVGFYVYNKGSVEKASKEGIETIKNIDPDEVKEKADSFTEETRKRFFETFGENQ